MKKSQKQSRCLFKIKSIMDCKSSVNYQKVLIPTLAITENKLSQREGKLFSIFMHLRTPIPSRRILVQMERS